MFLSSFPVCFSNPVFRSDVLRCNWTNLGSFQQAWMKQINSNISGVGGSGQRYSNHHNFFHHWTRKRSIKINWYVITWQTSDCYDSLLILIDRLFDAFKALMTAWIKLQAQRLKNSHKLFMNNGLKASKASLSAVYFKSSKAGCWWSKLKLTLKQTFRHQRIVQLVVANNNERRSRRHSNNIQAQYDFGQRSVSNIERRFVTHDIIQIHNKRCSYSSRLERDQSGRFFTSSLSQMIEIVVEFFLQK